MYVFTGFGLITLTFSILQKSNILINFFYTPPNFFLPKFGLYKSLKCFMLAGNFPLVLEVAGLCWLLIVGMNATR